MTIHLHIKTETISHRLHIFVSVRVLVEFTIFIGCRFDYDLYRGVDGEKIIAICLVLSDKF